ncbi:MAG: division/cell wall cluster transcriptional repressor MraZ [Clostridium sp.]|nr:division/cell wall cluster transcriptional repressor MraZ [Clostridium sp.]
MYMGRFDHTIDAKGRMNVPSRFRDELGDEFVITQGLDGCIAVYDLTEWQKFEERLKTLPQTDPDARKYIRFSLSCAYPCEVDKQGRILIPTPLREYAKLTKDVVVSGALDKVEIWDKDRFIEENQYDNINEVSEKLKGYKI